MCGHVFLYQNSNRLQQHRPRWTCGTCGRVSSVPLDCCTRPDFAQPSRAALTHILGQWVSACGLWTHARMRALWRWQRQPATSMGQTRTMAGSQSAVIAAEAAPALLGAESPELQDVVVAAGERL